MAEEREFGWDDEIENDNEFQILPDGDYNFTVTGFERGRHQGSAKLPPCNKAIITLNVADGKDNRIPGDWCIYHQDGRIKSRRCIPRFTRYD